MSNIIKCQDSLINLAEKQGYLTFDDILDASYTFSLSIPEVDMVSAAIQLRGVIVYETAPQQFRQDGIDEDELDYSRTDYDAIYSELLYLAPQLSTFIKRVRSFPAPKYRETNLLAKQIAEGNKFARNRLISMYMRNVLKIALSMSKQYDFDIEETISSGLIGLINAVDKYDPSGFSVFHSFASLYIQQSIQRECIPTWMIYYFPFHAKEKMFKIFQIYETLSSGEKIGSNDYYSIISFISDETELPESIVEEAIKNVINQKFFRCSIDDINESSKDESKIPYELIVGEDIAFDVFYRRESVHTVQGFLTCLTDREKQVIMLRNGIEAQRPLTLEEIGSILGVTRERVRQIEDKALRKLRYHISRQYKHLYEI